MNLYHVSQTQNDEYDTYSDFVICAETEDEARHADPNTGRRITEEGWKARWSDWCNDPKHVSVRLIGAADESVEAGVICSSYHAG